MEVVSLITSSTGTIYTVAASTVAEVELVMSDTSTDVDINSVGGAVVTNWIDAANTVQLKAGTTTSGGSLGVFTNGSNIMPVRIKLGPAEYITKTGAGDISFIIYEEATGTHP